MTNGIPKKIHFCWFGKGEKTQMIKKCIASWKQNMPDYEIIEWNEDNFDVNCNPYVKQAYENKKWAFVTDYVRLKVLFEHGGIYLDTDVEVLKNFDSLLNGKSFIGLESLDEMVTGVLTATIGMRPSNQIIGEIITLYDKRNFIVNGSMDLTTNVKFITNYLMNNYKLELANKLQILNEDLIIYPSDYFCPKNSCTKLKITDNTYSIHHFDGSWVSNGHKFKSLISYNIKKVFRIIRKK